MQQSSTIRINPADTVIVCLRPMHQGEIIEVDHQQITLLEDVPMGHKVLIRDTRKGEDIIKYGYPIGHAFQDLKDCYCILPLSCFESWSMGERT